MADADASNEDLDDLLDSALDDFQEFGSSSARSKATLGQGLGAGLPALGPGRKKSTSSKASSTSKSVASGRDVSPRGRGSTEPKANLGTTLEKLAQQTRQTVESIDAAPQDDSAGDELVENLVKQFEELGASQDMHSIMDTMMRQLLSKDVLHEPMKEIGERYPQWLESHKAQLSADDLSRYTRQYEFVRQLCHVYETTPDDFQNVVDLMQRMQDCGQPPSDIVRELAPGLELGDDGLPVLPDISVAGASGTPANCSIM